MPDGTYFHPSRMVNHYFALEDELRQTKERLAELEQKLGQQAVIFHEIPRTEIKETIRKIYLEDGTLLYADIVQKANLCPAVVVELVDELALESGGPPPKTSPGRFEQPRQFRDVPYQPVRLHPAARREPVTGIVQPDCKDAKCATRREVAVQVVPHHPGFPAGRVEGVEDVEEAGGLRLAGTELPFDDDAVEVRLQGKPLQLGPLHICSPVGDQPQLVTTLAEQGQYCQGFREQLGRDFPAMG
jgi:hypothetical protein